MHGKTTIKIVLFIPCTAVNRLATLNWIIYKILDVKKLKKLEENGSDTNNCVVRIGY
jgi:hypothetical protein